MKYKFLENEDVAHIDNLDQKMTIKRVKYVNVTRPDKTVHKKIKGILCYWFVDGKYQEQPFHSERLVPWQFAIKRITEAERWLKNMGAKKYKDD